MDDLNINIPEVDVRTNARIKVYPDGTKNIMVCSNNIFRDPFFISQDSNDYHIEKEVKKLDSIKKYLGVDSFKDISPDIISDARSVIFSDNQLQDTDSRDVRYDSLKRANDSVFDYIMSNDFDYFVTLTFNPEYVDSYSSKDVAKVTLNWFKNMVKRYGLSYIAVAEPHPSSGRIHFHSLMRSEKPLNWVDSGTKKYDSCKRPVSNEKAEKLGLSGGRTVYNLSNWRFGWSTAIKLNGDKQRLSRYISKYITKDLKKYFGRFFWHSRDLRKPQITYENIDFDSFDSLDYGGFKYRLDRSDNTNDSNRDNVTL